MARLGLANFSLQELSKYTAEGLAGESSVIPADADHWLFYVGRDDVHSILLFLHSNFLQSMVGNMFGYDDDQLNAAIWEAVMNPAIYVRETLDKSQAGGVHEKKILASDEALNAAAFGNSFAIIESETGQISHTKGGILDGVVGYDGSTNWSVSGEGEFVTPGKPGGAGYKAQNNTLHVFVDSPSLRGFRTELDREYDVAKKFS
jgi:hypothetical protein